MRAKSNKGGSKKKLNLEYELKAGEQSGFVKNFDRKKFIKTLHDKYIANKSDTALQTPNPKLPH